MSSKLPPRRFQRERRKIRAEKKKNQRWSEVVERSNRSRPNLKRGKNWLNRRFYSIVSPSKDKKSNQGFHSIKEVKYWLGTCGKTGGKTSGKRKEEATWHHRVKCSRPYDLMPRHRVQWSSFSFARISLTEVMMIKEKIQPWSCRRNQANWSLGEEDRRRCLLGSMDDMYKQRANSSGCFPLLPSNKKHLSSCISFELITMTSLVSHVSILINWCEWTSHAQEPSGLEKRKKKKRGRGSGRRRRRRREASSKR